MTAAGSTVEFNGGDQTVNALAYTNLILGGSGSKTFSDSAVTTVSGMTTINGVNVIGGGYDSTADAFRTQLADVTVTGSFAAIANVSASGMMTVNAANTRITGSALTAMTAGRNATVSVENSSFTKAAGVAVTVTEGAAVTMLNSTVANNNGNSAISVESGAMLNLLQVTVAGNSGIGVNVAKGAAFNALDSIIAYNGSAGAYSDMQIASGNNIKLVSNVLGSFVNSAAISTEGNVMNRYATDVVTASPLFGANGTTAVRLANGTYGITLAETTIANEGKHITVYRTDDGMIKGAAYTQMDGSLATFTGNTAGEGSMVLTDQAGSAFVTKEYGIIGAIAATHEALTLVVTTSSEDGQVGTTLREAIANAKALGGGTITFKVGISSVTLDSDLTIEDSVTINAGNGVTVTASAADVDITVSGSGTELVMKNLTLDNVAMNFGGKSLYAENVAVQNVKSAESSAAVNINSGSATFRAGTFNGNEGGRDIFVAANASLTVLTAPVVSAVNGIVAPVSEAPEMMMSFRNRPATDGVTSSNLTVMNVYSSEEDEEFRNSTAAVPETMSATTMFSVVGELDTSSDTISPDSDTISMTSESLDAYYAAQNRQSLLSVSDNITTKAADVTVDGDAAEGENIPADETTTAEEDMEALQIAMIDFESAAFGRASVCRNAFDDALESMLTLS